MNYIRFIERVFLVTILLSMVGLFGFNVFTRELGGTLASQFAWIEEAVRLMNIFLVFGALGLALERGRHVGIDTLRESLPDNMRLIVRKVIDLTGTIFSAYMAYLSYEILVFVLSTGQRSPTLDIPVGWLYLAPTVGFAFLSLRYLLSLITYIDRYRNDGEQESNVDLKGARS